MRLRKGRRIPVISSGVTGGRKNYTFSESAPIFRIPNLLKRYRAYKAGEKYYPFQDFEVRIRTCTPRSHEILREYNYEALAALEVRGSQCVVELCAADNGDSIDVTSLSDYRGTYKCYEKDEIPMIYFLNKDGDYIGNPEAQQALLKIGITYPKPLWEGCTCRTGWSHKEHKWFGWSHRAMCGFGVGSEINTKDHCCYPDIEVGFKATNLDEAQWMAQVFARSVS